MPKSKDASQVHYQSAYFIVRWILGILFLLGTIIPYWELAAGVLLIIAYRMREVLTSLGVLLPFFFNVRSKMTSQYKYPICQAQ